MRTASGGIGAIAAGLAALALTGCQPGGTVDKAGSEVTVLRLASIDKPNDNGQSYGPQAFIDNLAKLSGGRIKVEVNTKYGEGAADAETDLVKAIASGDLDGGWPATRAFAGSGIHALDAVEAPMTITSYAAEKDLVSGPVAGRLLDGLKGSGVVGMGLTVGPLRRPFTADSPLLAVEDWNGAQFRVFNSPVQSRAIRALGATPVNVSFGWIDQVREGKLRGAEFDLAQYARNGYAPDAGQLTSNVVLWPKIFVLSLSQARYDALTDQQREWVRAAAHAAVQASVDAGYDEQTLAQDLCGKGVQFAAASPQQLAGMRTALAPVIDELAADATSGPVMKDLQAIAAKHPQPDVPAATGSCGDGKDADTASTAVGPVPKEVSTLPDGTYRTSVSLKEVQAAGISNDDGLTGTWTLTVRRGTYEIGCRPLDLPGTDCGNEVYDGPLDVGDLRGTGNTVYFVHRPDRLSRITGCRLPVSTTEQDHCGPGGGYRMSWKVSGDQLTFTDYRNDYTQHDVWVVKAFQKIS